MNFFIETKINQTGGSTENKNPMQRLSPAQKYYASVRLREMARKLKRRLCVSVNPNRPKKFSSRRYGTSFCMLQPDLLSVFIFALNA
jgi:hypothetical protein